MERCGEEVRENCVEKGGIAGVCIENALFDEEVAYHAVS